MYFPPLTWKAVFVHQQLAKLPRTHGSLDQRSLLRSSLAHSSCSCQFNLVHRFLPTYYCRFPQFAKVFTHKRFPLYGIFCLQIYNSLSREWGEKGRHSKGEGMLWETVGGTGTQDFEM